MSYSVEVVADFDPISPRDDDNLGTIYYSSQRYKLGDECVDKSEIDRIINDPQMIHLPVYAYIHSGVCLNTTGFSCPWDSGMSGIIAVSKEDIRRRYGVKRITAKLMEKVFNALRAEVEIYSAYINGDVFGFQVRDDNGDIVDSCYGFYSEREALEEGNHSLRFYQNKAA
jgi:hypothetical protein